MTVREAIEILKIMDPAAIFCVAHKSYPGDEPDIDEVSDIDYQLTTHYVDTDGLEQWGLAVSAKL